MTHKVINLLSYLDLDQLLTPQNECLKHHILATITHIPVGEVNLSGSSYTDHSQLQFFIYEHYRETVKVLTQLQSPIISGNNPKKYLTQTCSGTASIMNITVCA